MQRIFSLFVFFTAWLSADAQMLTLDSCRALALRNNKQLEIARVKQDAAQNTRKAVRTKYLPRIDALGGYEFFSREVSVLNDGQKTTFANLGSAATTSLGTNMSQVLAGLVQQGLVSPDMAQQVGTVMSQLSEPLSQAGNQVGQRINDAFRTDTRNIWAASIMLRQPVYMGGAITAANRMADINEELTANETKGMIQSTISNIDELYWTVVSLKQTLKLAYSYRDLVQKLNDDVHKMINEGVATHATGLQVDVRVNEADMQMTQVENGLVLTKMLLCQLCGLPLDEDITLADEDRTVLSPTVEEDCEDDVAFDNRAELRMLQNAIDLSEEATKLIRDSYLPQVALTGGYLISNPNLFNGFERKFAGVWNIGLMVRIPVWNWFEGEYKIRASRSATNIACMELSDAREKVELQLSQCRFKMKEAGKRLETATKNLSSADENLRCANIGFQEGVMEASDVMAAQTAWQQAQSQKIDAEVDVKLAHVALQKALGIIPY